MRIDQLYPSSIEFEVKDALGNPTDLKLKIVGASSKEYIAVARNNYKVTHGKELHDNVEFFYQCRVELNVSSIVGWSGLEDENGKQVPFSKEKAIELLSNPELEFILTQVEEQVAQREKFFRGAVK